MNTETFCGNDINTSDMRYQSMLSRKNGKVSGAMSPVMAAQIFCRENKFPFDGLVRIWFDSEEVHNRYEGPGKSCLTGCDTLMVLSRYSNLDQVTMFVDMGCECLPVCLYLSDERSLTITPVYQEYPFAKKCDATELTHLIEEALKQNKFDIINQS